MTTPRQMKLFAGSALGASALNASAILIVTRFPEPALSAAMLGLTVIAVLLFWTVRGRSLAGRLVVSAWLTFCIVRSVLGFAMILFGHEKITMSPPVMLLSLMTLALNCAAVFFLWTRPSTEWLLAKPKPGR